MNVAPPSQPKLIDDAAPVPVATRSKPSDRADTFRAEFARAISASRPKPSENEAREAAKGLIASAFLVPVLASVRESSFAVGPYAPTTTERRFGPILDQQIADRVMQGTNFALVDAIVDRYVKETEA